MPSTLPQEVSKLSLDLKNYRTVPQKNEKNAIKAMITIKPERFYAMMKSIIENGFFFTENIIVLKDGDTLMVKEGNRRIAALKIIHGIYKPSDFHLPTNIIALIKGIDDNWKKENLKVPCVIYNKSESDIADRVVALTHAKGEQASRDDWESVATARYNRDAKGISEPALDLLEKYIKVGKNLTEEQKERWAGDYPLTILAEAVRLLYPRLEYKTAIDFVNKYPKIKGVTEIENIIRDIGLKLKGFKEVRASHFFEGYGFTQPPVPVPTMTIATGAGSKSTPTKSGISTTTATSATTSSGTKTPITTVATPLITKGAKKAVAINDPKNVKDLLKRFVPKGKNREKVVTLKEEIIKLDITKTPIAFCFLLRSLFEISAKVYCEENGISLTKPTKGTVIQHKTLADLLKDASNHYISKGGTKDKDKEKALHGAATEIGKTESILSVTSMNHLVHNPKFSIMHTDICTVFGNIFPLLEAMNS